MSDKFDYILMNHSFEHMNDHKEVLLKSYDLLNNNGLLIIRIPIASYAWHMYRTNWFQLDAPRHFILHSFKSLELLINETNFEIENFYTDSNIDQFFYSEMYKKEISLVEQNSIDAFTKEQIEHFQNSTNKLNQECLGDQICIYLRKREHE